MLGIINKHDAYDLKNSMRNSKKSEANYERFGDGPVVIYHANFVPIQVIVSCLIRPMLTIGIFADACNSQERVDYATLKQVNRVLYDINPSIKMNAKTFEMENLHLDEFPKCAYGFRNVSSISIEGNSLKDLPFDFAKKLPLLEKLWMRNNQFDALPEAVLKLNMLKELHVDYAVEINAEQAESLRNKGVILERNRSLRK